MIVSMHVTHSSAGGTEGLNNVVPILEAEVGKRVSVMDQVSEFVIVRTCNRFEVYTATSDNRTVSDYLQSILRTIVPSTNISYILEDRESIRHLFRVVCGAHSRRGPDPAPGQGVVHGRQGEGPCGPNADAPVR